MLGDGLRTASIRAWASIPSRVSATLSHSLNSACSSVWSWPSSSPSSGTCGHRSMLFLSPCKTRTFVRVFSCARRTPRWTRYLTALPGTSGCERCLAWGLYTASPCPRMRACRSFVLRIGTLPWLAAALPHPLPPTCPLAPTRRSRTCRLRPTISVLTCVLPILSPPLRVIRRPWIRPCPCPLTHRPTLLA